MGYKKNHMLLPKLRECKISIIGLGYVGLPLAVQFVISDKCRYSNNKLDYKVIGFDINTKRVEELKKGFDSTQEIDQKVLTSIKNIKFTSNSEEIENSDVYIVTVPTPIDNNNQPDMKPLKLASKTIGNALKNRLLKYKNSELSLPIIIYESTVYPGATEEICVPIIEYNSGLTLNNLDPEKGFLCGYSPERINPGDKNNTINSIKKVTSGSDNNSKEWINNLYKSIIDAGTYSAKSIKVAEAAKIIENTQRDINIALINELAVICEKIGIDTLEVLEAARTKWNFLDFKPGLVGGHCIGVDPYYLTFKARELGYNPKVVLAGREINDSMSKWIVDTLIKTMAKKNIPIGGSKVLVMGYTFKENCPDVRNTKVRNILFSLKEYNLDVALYDPYINLNYQSENLDFVKPIEKLEFTQEFDALIVSVFHKEFEELGIKEWEKLVKKNNAIIDIKGHLPRSLNPIRI